MTGIQAETTNSMWTHTAGVLSAKIFVEFISLIVRNRIYNLLKETMLRLQAKTNYMNVPKTIRELEKIEMVRRNNGYYCLDHAVTKKQKMFLSSFGLADIDVSNSTAEISRILGNKQSFLTDIDEENDTLENEEDDFYGGSEINICD